MNTKTRVIAPGKEMLPIVRFIRNHAACRRWRIAQINRFGAAVAKMSRDLGVPFELREDPGIGRCKFYRRALMEIAFSEINRH